ncbi:MAG: EVE domain-containing protein [Bacteroidetes bacterium]|nr:EVE domain-containing protein [Bacteroidota bacterium]MBU1719568.1 EVE domain-containing protein [Bacteroidota bacterium]
MNYWLAKSDPEEYSFQDLLREKSTIWDGVRNFQARNNIAAMKKGDWVLIYHSGKEKSVAGIAKVSKPPASDPTSSDKRWLAVELTAVRSLKNSVSLDILKKQRLFQNHALIKQPRLSVMPVTKEEFVFVQKVQGGGGSNQ